jgi:hypothetical protein
VHFLLQVEQVGNVAISSFGSGFDSVSNLLSRFWFVALVDATLVDDRVLVDDAALVDAALVDDDDDAALVDDVALVDFADDSWPLAIIA